MASVTVPEAATMTPCCRAVTLPLMVPWMSSGSCETRSPLMRSEAPTRLPGAIGEGGEVGSWDALDARCAEASAVVAEGALEAGDA
ncbi:hypothetical protein QLQ85_05255 [Halomonas sp. M4R5S39]|uniref:hypothetical protein n=1 Tax=Halomonas kalidii TaxID=3043293 RepID=UPI0024A8EE6D|nr:hypothetical protein [Halomonas kalidii]MDI5984190.1 hypothetical protein [Halomonas kalidii]